MKVLIVYFSQTGNTKKIAKQIQGGILNSGNECELVKIKKANIMEFDNYDLIGIGTPTFFYREPRNVRSFIQGLKEVDEKHCFIFCSHGSLIGNTFFYMSEELTKKSYLIINSFDSYSASSIQFYPEIMHTHGHPDEQELEEAEKFGKNICNISLKIQNGETKLIPKFELTENAWWAIDSEKLTLDVLRNISPKFIVNPDLCTKCLMCQENCPVDAIDMEADPPEIQKEGCIFCWYCEKLCPEGAIEAEWDWMRVASKKNLKLYVDALKKAEIQGKFRPYVDYEKIL